MKIITYNLNGIRAALKKGLIDFLVRENPVVACFQELKADIDQIDEAVFKELGYFCYWHPAQKKGYSGVGIISKIEASIVIIGCNNDEFDSEGRVLSADINGVRIVSAYFPSGTTGDIRQEVKYRFLDYFFNWANDQKKFNEKVIVCGDYNICHKEIDIHNPVSNKNSSGFLPEERAWMDKWFNSGWVDSFRTYNKEPQLYTWWSYRAGARKNNKGWRIDYISTSNSIEIKNSGFYPKDIQSDHCASFVELIL